MLKRLLPLLVVLLLCVLGKANDRLSRMVDETSGGQEVCSHDGFLLSAESSIALLRALPSVGNLASAMYEDKSWDYKLPDEVGNLYRTEGKKDRKYGKGGQLQVCLLYESSVARGLNPKPQGLCRSKHSPAMVNETKSACDWGEGIRLRSSFTHVTGRPKMDGHLYDYDEEGNLIAKESRHGRWSYDWYGGGMPESEFASESRSEGAEPDATGRFSIESIALLWFKREAQRSDRGEGGSARSRFSDVNSGSESVQRPDGEIVEFEYDALGRRTAKTFDGQVTRFVWDGNVPLHEWTYAKKDRPRMVLDQYGFLEKSHEEPVPEVTTWVFEEGTFKPAAKMVGEESYSIITDYLGTPVEAYASDGKQVWTAEYDIYGKRRKGTSASLSDLIGEKCFVPFRYQGQYEDEETGLFYNRHRYYSPHEGIYLSQDPISLDGGRNLYAFVKDVNSWVDVFGLSGTHGHHSDPKFMGGEPKQPLTTMSQADHVQLHRDMNAHLETKINPHTGTSMRPKRGNSGAIIRERFTRGERLDALGEFYNKNKKKYPAAATDFFAQHPNLQKISCS